MCLFFFPIRKASREWMGVAQIALARMREIERFCPRYLFILNDLATILPGKQTTSGQALGAVVNNSDNVSLTPGSLGGLYISWGFAGVIGFHFFIGAILSYLWNSYRRRGSPWHLICCILILIYLVQFTFRGLFKPMYILMLVVVWFIWAWSKLLKRDRMSN